MSIERMEYSTAYIKESLEGKVVVDLGCGAGSQAAHLGRHRRPRLVIGIDNYQNCGGVSEEDKIRFITKISTGRKSNVCIIQSDAFKMPLKTSSVDVLICTNSLHHMIREKKDIRDLDDQVIEDLTVKVGELARILKPGGSLIIRDVCRYGFLRILAPYNIPRNTSTIHYDTKQEAAAWGHLLGRVGFSVNEVDYYVPFKLRRFNKLLRKRPFNFWINMTYHIYATVKK